MTNLTRTILSTYAVTLTDTIPSLRWITAREFHSRTRQMQKASRWWARQLNPCSPAAPPSNHAPALEWALKLAWDLEHSHTYARAWGKNPYPLSNSSIDANCLEHLTSPSQRLEPCESSTSSKKQSPSILNSSFAIQPWVPINVMEA